MGKRFIHASGQVRYNSLDPKDPDFSERRLQSFLRARRIIGAPESSGGSFPYSHSVLHRQTMSINRRSFLHRAALAGAAAVLAPRGIFSSPIHFTVNDMKLRFTPYTLELKHTFTIATSSRTTTPDMMVEVEKDGIIGYGEASMPPYLGESQESAAAFLSKVDLTKIPRSIPVRRDSCSN